jgi:hypothetical protein
MHTTHWAAILGDAGVAVGICFAAVAARFAQKTSSRSVKVTETMAAIEKDRRHAERIPRLTARLEAWGTGSEDLLLSVWLDTPEALGRLRVVVQEARNSDGPVGFKPGQNGVGHELPWPQEEDEVEGVLPAWRADSLRPVADWTDRMAPGSAAVWGMQIRRSADMAGGSVAVRLKALCWADRDDQMWEIPVPVTFSVRAQDMIDTACKNSDH